MARPKGEDRGLEERPKGSGVWYIRYHDHLGKEHREKVGPKALAGDKCDACGHLKYVTDLLASEFDWNPRGTHPETFRPEVAKCWLEYD